MIDDITHRQLVNTSYYDDMTRISNSNIGWFLEKGPTYLHSMLTGTAEGIKGSQLVRGTMIHEYLLQPEEFQKHYVVWDKCRPSSEQQEKFCQELAQSIEIEPNNAIISAYRASYKSLPKSDDLVLSKGLELANTMSSYIDFLRSNDNRTIITPYQANMLSEIKQNITEHKMASQLLKHEGRLNNIETFHEFHINWEYEGVKCKSLLDSVTFDYDNKVCILMDVKTTVHIGNFSTSINTYDYLRQLCYYTLALKWFIEHEIKDEPELWSFKWYIIAIDTTGTNEVRVFEFSEDQIESKLDIINSVIKEINWHLTNDKWDHTRSYYEGNGAEKLTNI